MADFDTVMVAQGSVSVTVDEDDGKFVEVCLVLSVDVVENPFTVELFFSSESTATLGEDFQANIVIPDGCPLFPSNDPVDRVIVDFVPPNNTACGFVTILDDGIFEDEELIVLNINETFVSDILLVEGSSANITILKDQEGRSSRITLGKSHYSRPSHIRTLWDQAQFRYAKSSDM